MIAVLLTLLKLIDCADLEEWSGHHIDNPLEVLAQKFPKPTIISHYALSENWKMDLHDKVIASLSSNGWSDLHVCFLRINTTATNPSVILAFATLFFN
jgi:hypothetical protein